MSHYTIIKHHFTLASTSYLNQNNKRTGGTDITMASVGGTKTIETENTDLSQQQIKYSDKAAGNILVFIF